MSTGDHGAERRLSITTWTASGALAVEADAAGVDRVGCDLERTGKRARQPHSTTWIADHEIDDVRRVGAVLRRARLFARCDPFDGSDPTQIEALLAEGVEVLMLPMVENPDPIAAAATVIAGRAVLIALIETRRGVEAAAEIAEVDGLDEIYLGPNDLRVSLGVENRFEAIVSEEAERVALAAHAGARTFGVAGIATVGDARVPISPELVYAHYARLGVAGTILGRAFLSAPGRLTEKIAALRSRYAEIQGWSPAELDAASAELARRARVLGHL